MDLPRLDGISWKRRVWQILNGVFVSERLVFSLCMWFHCVEGSITCPVALSPWIEDPGQWSRSYSGRVLRDSRWKWSGASCSAYTINDSVKAWSSPRDATGICCTGDLMPCQNSTLDVGRKIQSLVIQQTHSKNHICHCACNLIHACYAKIQFMLTK